ncbi:MAG: OsmC family peroxiredoxin [Gemmatimonadales bacterium]|nr:MAG: OsmC family peroxiredoxin [Gemmatimonadales bacterium]
MAVRSSSAIWKGNLAEGTGTVSTESGTLTRAGYSFPSRFETGPGTNPEELIGAAHSGCYAMALSHELAEAGHAPESVHATAQVHLDKVDGGFEIGRIELSCEAIVPGIEEDAFQEIAMAAARGCPVSKALSATTIEVNARLA